MDRYKFTKDDTKCMKGLAVLLMLAHHLWGFPDRLPSGLPMTSVTARGMEFAGFIGGYGKICVSLFMFLGGLGTYIWYEQKKSDWFAKIRGLYLSYWKVFFVFVPIGFLLKIVRRGYRRIIVRILRSAMCLMSFICQNFLQIWLEFRLLITGNGGFFSVILSCWQRFRLL